MASFIAPIVSGLSSLFGGLFGSNAQGNAANQLQQGYQTGINTLQSGEQTALGQISGITDEANANLQPYINAGNSSLQSLTSGLAPGGNLNSQSMSPSEILQQNPGYQFDLQQGEQAIQRQASANGTALSGGELKDITNYAQNNALNAYQTAFQNFNTSNQLQVQNLMGLTGLGQQETNTQNSNLLNLGNTEAGLTTNLAQQTAGLQGQIGQAQAAGTLGQAGSLIGGVQGASSPLTALLQSIFGGGSGGSGGGLGSGGFGGLQL